MIESTTKFECLIAHFEAEREEIEAELEEISCGKADLERAMTEISTNSSQRARFEVKLAQLRSRQ